MRSSLAQIFFSFVVGACLATVAFGQVRNQGAGYWQPSSQPYQTIGYSQNSDCGCSPEVNSAPMTAFNDSSCGCGACGIPETYGGYGSGCSTGGCGFDTCDPCGDTGYFGWDMDPCQVNQWFLTGWIQQGVTINPYWPRNKSNGTLRYNDRANDYQMNQLYLTAGRSVNSEACNWDIGGRVDVLYGTDYFFTSALGWETRTTLDGRPILDPTGADQKWNPNKGPRRDGNAALYGLSIPQLYGEIQAPMGANVKLGHFYSPMGHESVMATQNFFYSHSYSMMYGEPTTLTGMLLSQRVTRNWTGYFGIHRGWDKWETPIDHISYLAGAKWENYYRTTSVGFLINMGTDAYTFGPRRTANRVNYSLVFSHQLSPNLHYVLQHDLGVDQNAAYELDASFNVKPLDGTWYSISQYIYLQLLETLAFGCRVEWFKDENHSRILKPTGPIRSSFNSITGEDYVELTLGFNWKPTPCVTLRPEVRWDWVNGREITTKLGGQESNLSGPFNDNTKNNQFTIGTDLVITF